MGWTTIRGGVYLVALALGAPAGAATVNVAAGEDWCAAVNAMGAGDEVVLGAGDHAGPCWIQTSGAEGDPLVIRGEDGPHPQIVYEGGGDNVINVFGSHLVLRHLAFGPTQTSITAIKVREEVGGVAIEDCEFVQVGGVAIAANSGDSWDLVVRDCRFTDLQATGLYFGCHTGAGDCSSSDVLVEGNLFDGVTSSGVGYGLEIKVDSFGVVRDNVIHDTQGPGIEIFGSYDDSRVSYVTGNLVMGSRANASLEIGGGPCIVHSNIVVGGVEGAIYAYDYDGRGLQRGVTIAGNTAVGVDERAIRISSWDGDDLTLANNALWREGGAELPQLGGNVVVQGNVLCPTAGDCFADASQLDYWPAEGGPLVDGSAGVLADAAAHDFCDQAPLDPPHAGAFQRTEEQDPGGLSVDFKATFDCPQPAGDDDDAADDDDDDASGDDDQTDDDDSAGGAGGCSCSLETDPARAGGMLLAWLAISGIGRWLLRGYRSRNLRSGSRPCPRPAEPSTGSPPA